MALLTITEQQTFKTIDYNWSNKVRVVGGVSNYEQLEQEVEETDLSDLLGIALLQDIQANPSTANNLLLLNGSTFTDCNDNTIAFKGIKYALAYMVHYRYMNSINVQDTASGTVRKDSNESTFALKGEVTENRNFSKKIALREFDLIKQFLNENETDYPLWICSESKNNYTPQMFNIRKTIN